MFVVTSHYTLIIAQNDCIICYLMYLLASLQFHEYAHTCAHLLHFRCSYLGNHCELDQCVYDISDSELALELNLEVLTLTSGTPVFY